MGGDITQNVQCGGGPAKDVKGEVLIQSPPQATSSPSIAPHQELELHLSGGEVHFHDRHNHLKAAVPVAEFYVTMRAIRQMNEFEWVDPQFNTLLKLTPYRDGDIVECFISLEPIKVGTTFAALAKYTQRR